MADHLNPNDYYVFEVDQDVDYLKRLMKRLYSEDRMTGDEMRNEAQRLNVVIDRLMRVTILA